MVGPNAVKVLHEIGVLEDVLASSNEPEVNQRSFIYYRGMGDHELVYAVSDPSTVATIRSSPTAAHSILLAPQILV